MENLMKIQKSAKHVLPHDIRYGPLQCSRILHGPLQGALYKERNMRAIAEYSPQLLES